MQFQESKGIIPSENGFHEIAPSYGTITEEYHEAIFLKDLADDGFEMYNRHNYIPVDHAHLVMKILGKLHAISYAMKVLFKQLYRLIFNCPFGFLDVDNIYLQVVSNNSIISMVTTGLGLY